ncbi:MAG TPA: PH domain-containing protein [Solirubrobacteraceae bacterium]|nr:PH domain-containing protein [Solirubrobacteraceae bacterium]
MSSEEPAADEPVADEPAADVPAADEPARSSPDTGIAPRRLHPAGIAVLGVASLRGLALPLGIAFATTVFGGGGGQPIARAVVYAVIGAVIAVIAGYVRWRTTTWSVGDGTIRLRTGVLSEKETDIPLGRVQAIDTVHGPLQRLFGVRGVQVQTAGGGKEGEITLPAVGPADVELIRAALRRRAAPAAATAGRAPLAERRLGGRRLLVGALTAGQVGVLLPLLAALPQLGEQLWGNDIESAGREGLRFVPDSMPEWIVAGVGLLLVAWLLSTAAAVLAFAGFTIARDEDRLRVRRGLLARREATVPVARVQAVRVVEGLLRRPFGLATVHVEVAGYAKEAAAAQTLFPLLRRSEVEPFLAELLPELADGIDRLDGAPRRALRRYLLPPTALAVALGGAACLAVPAAAPWPLLAALPAAALGAARWRAAGWRIEDRRLAIRFRRLARTTVLAPTARLQEHGVRQTVLQRRARLADVDVRVGAGTHGLVRHLDARVAGRVFDALRGEEVVSDRRAPEPAPPPARTAPRR